ncbi:RNA 2',3'-cyclic phosphodiesterase [Ramlibacter sp. USB13]|uniref:RNA 2',3'-cyclic phosphodiesterase n=1 Tax=Ramlibacter cellulosilyticus TaxID=2764187 RepID=A0A923SAZ5_9BURK|nr:RNA 2',3'-cyclic phosphodiesterase [Ramlibacter cellulosilyticus]MBC5783279.1 RNA 2',3'-cyclic phosphodiesterase [Ramlibacter cellulosilyticus]
MPAVEAADLRLFLALWPAPGCREQLVAHADGWSWPERARRTRPERLHVTLHFIGNVAAARLPELREGLDVGPADGAGLVLDEAKVWHGGIAVLEASRVPAALADLHGRLAERLQALQLPVESRPWRPHVTLARKASGARPLAFAPLPWSGAPGYALVRTLGGGRGYETVQAFG